MACTIAITGKGGTGKTTLAALLVRILRERAAGSILAVDADPNSNLGEVLGTSVSETIGAIIDEIARSPGKIPPGISKDRFIEYEVQQALEEQDAFDLLTMGRPEGPGCYCYANAILRNIMSKLTNDYNYVIIDNEAGLEHLSRRTSRSADILAVVSDSTKIGLRSAARIAQLVEELKIEMKRKVLLINKQVEPIAEDPGNAAGLEYLGALPLDPSLFSCAVEGKSIWELSDDSPALSALRELVTRSGLLV